MNCEEVRQLMQRYLDKDLDETENRMLHQHLPECPECAGMFDRLRHLSSELENLPKVMPPFSIVDSILPQLEQIDLLHTEEVASKEAMAFVEKTKPQRKISWPIFGGVVAAGIVLGMFVFQPPSLKENADGLLLRKTNTEQASQLAANQSDFELKAAEKKVAQMDEPTASAANTTSPRNDSMHVMDAVPPSISSMPQTSAESSQASAQGMDAGLHSSVPAPQSDTDKANAGIGLHPQEEPTIQGFTATDQYGAAVEQPSSKLDMPPNAMRAASPSAASPAPAPSGDDISISMSMSMSLERTGITESMKLQGESDPAPKTMSINNSIPEQQMSIDGRLSSLVSLDGLYFALVEDQRVIVKNVDDGETVYTSILQWHEGDKIMLMHWSEGSTLTYEVKYEAGSKQMNIDVTNKTETSF